MKLQTITTNFTAGELSPRLAGRTDLEKYNAGVKAGRNVVGLKEGGVTARPSRVYCGSTKGGGDAILIPFVYSRADAFDLEIGDGYARIWRAGTLLSPGSGAYEISTPWAAADLDTLDWRQGADTLIVVHPDYPPHRIVRYAALHWICEPIEFAPAPLTETGHMSATQDVGISTGGATQPIATLSAGSITWQSGDIGRVLSSGYGAMRITTLTPGNPYRCEGEWIRPWGAASLAAGTWRLEGSPQATLTPSAAGPVGQSITVSTGGSVYGSPVAIIDITWAPYSAPTVGGMATYEMLTAHGLTSGESVYVSGCVPSALNGTYVVTVVNATKWEVYRTSWPGSPTIKGAMQSIESTARAAFRAEDAGKYIEMNGGMLRIDAVTSADTIAATVITELTGTVACPPDGWSLLDGAWSEFDGYPSAVELFQQRLWFAGSRRWPVTLWGSRTGLNFDFLPGDADSDAVAKTLDGETNAIQYLAVVPGGMVALTLGGEYDIRGGIEKPITQANCQLTPRSSFGTERVKPRAAGRNLLMVQRGGDTVREITGADAGSESRDITIWSRHLLADGVRCMAWEAQPEGVMWIGTAAGTLLALTYSDEQQQVTLFGGNHQGQVRSLSSTPNGDEWTTHCITRYTIGGEVVHYVERLAWDQRPGLDCMVSRSGSASTSWTVAELAGQVVTVVADGVHIGTASVSGSGALTISRPATALQVGLAYVPTVTLGAPELGAQGGTTQGQQLSTHEILVRFLDTASCTVNGEPVPFRRFDTTGTLDGAPPTYTGKLSVGGLGWALGESDITISQPHPYPWTVLAVIRSLSANQG